MAAGYDSRRVERRWQKAWEDSACFRVTGPPGPRKFYNYDSGPFPNGPLHVGHVRTYVLGDVTARYRRLRGRQVLYATEMDAFGLPNELAALARGVSPAAFTGRWIGIVTGQLRALGISYDWSRVVTTSDPRYYRWTQSLFLDLLELGLVERRDAQSAWCPRCATSLAGIQTVRECCWRCGAEVESRSLPQWFVRISRYSVRLRDGLDRLDGWSPSIRSQLAGFIGRESSGAGQTLRVRDWPVSRQRSWGTPIPVVHCDRCGVVPVSRSELPIRLPEDLEWSLGPRALSACERFVRVACPRCDGPARRETDTLDCYFDDIWCFMAAPAVRDGSLDDPFAHDTAGGWMPVDCFHSGQDTFFYLHLHRFLGRVLHATGRLVEAEPIREHVGYAMVVRDGRKMSTHLGNAISAGKLVRKYGADTVRVAVLWAGNPRRTLSWRPELIDRSQSFLEGIRVFTRTELPKLAGEPNDRETAETRPSRAASSLRRAADRSLARIATFLEESRPNAAIPELAGWFRRLRDFAAGRVHSRRLAGADAGILQDVTADFTVALSVLAPHLAEEMWAIQGRPGLVSIARWPDRPGAR